MWCCFNRGKKKTPEKDVNLFQLDQGTEPIQILLSSLCTIFSCYFPLPTDRLEELERQTVTEDRQSVIFKTIRVNIPKQGDKLNIEELYKISELQDNDKIVAIDGRNIDSIG